MNDNFLTSEAIIESLNGSFRDTLLLANFNSDCWRATTQDKDAAGILAQHTGADSKALRVRKYLFEGTPRHGALVSAISHAYALSKEMTKPFGKNGLRVLPASAVGEYLVALDAENAKIVACRDEFIAHYDDDVEVGRQHLGQLAPFAGELYKPKGKLPELFGITYDDPLPFPDKEDYGDMDQTTLIRLQMNLERSLRARMEITFAEALEDFADALRAVEDRLAAKLASFDAEAEEGKRKPAIKLTGAVLSNPVAQARILRRFARGEWAEKMGRIEYALDHILLAQGLSKDAEKVSKALTAVRSIRNGLGMR